MKYSLSKLKDLICSGFSYNDVVRDDNNIQILGRKSSILFVGSVFKRINIVIIIVMSMLIFLNIDIQIKSYLLSLLGITLSIYYLLYSNTKLEYKMKSAKYGVAYNKNGHWIYIPYKSMKNITIVSVNEGVHSKICDIFCTLKTGEFMFSRTEGEDYTNLDVMIKDNQSFKLGRYKLTKGNYDKLERTMQSWSLGKKMIGEVMVK